MIREFVRLSRIVHGKVEMLWFLQMKPEWGFFFSIGEKLNKSKNLS